MSDQAGINFGYSQKACICPHCHGQITSAVTTKASARTHLTALSLCLFGCCWIPYVMDSFNNRIHYCPSCEAYLGKFQTKC